MSGAEDGSISYHGIGEFRILSKTVAAEGEAIDGRNHTARPMKPVETSLIHRLLVPESVRLDSYPALVLLHGRGADEEDLAGLAEHLDERLLILSARAPFPFLYGGGYTWYEAGEGGVPEPMMFRTSYDRLSLFLHDVIAKYPVDASRLFVLGFSMGAVMSYALALTRPETFRGVIPHSGYIPEGTHLAYRWSDIPSTEFFIAHGTLDPVIPVDASRRARQLLERAGARLVYREYAIGHQICEESLAEISAWLRERLGSRPTTTA